MFRYAFLNPPMPRKEKVYMCERESVQGENIIAANHASQSPHNWRWSRWLERSGNLEPSWT
jgi:hypothetical protein